MNQLIIEQRHDGLLTLTMNRPDRRNALSADLLDALLEALERAAGDHAVRAVLLRGAGGIFSVGGDVKAMADPNEWQGGLEELTDGLRRRARISELLHEMPKPTVAMIEKAAAGAGLSLALACDFRIAGATAKITTAFAKVALSGDFGGSYFLTKLVGSAKARELYMTSPVVTGEGRIRSASSRGSCRTPSSNPWRPRSRAAGGRANAHGRLHQEEHQHRRNPEPQGTARPGKLHHSRCMATEDYQEATSAFLEKRPAAFTAR